MITEHALLYLGARVFAAAANLAAVAIFTRLAVSDVYGGYLLIFSWAFVIYGFLGQWIGAAFFAVYQHETAAAQIGTLGRLVVGALAAAGAVILSAALAGIVPWPIAGGLFLVVAALTLFITVMEAERTRLEAGIVSLILVARAALIVTFGALTLLAGGGALALAVALAAANIVAALPGLIRLAPYIIEPHQPAVLRRFFMYGWPLVIAFGVTALGQNVDRLVLAHVVGTAELGSYGATSDFLKQSFGVVSEAIVLAVVSIAKDATIRGDHSGAKRTLEDAFRALATTVMFGAAFMVTFADELVQVVFGPDFRETARILVPSLIIANGVLIFRAFYFGQAIYFGQSSRNEVIAAVLMLSVTGLLSATLIPRYGIFGAAWAATGGQIAACGVFLVARPRMPIPFASLLGIVAIAAAVGGADLILDHVAIMGPLARIAGKLMIFAAAGSLVIWRFNILGLRDFAGALTNRRLAPQPIEQINARIADRPWQ
jgi:O-antigen/teichoic acid export membrane protein